MAKEFMNQPFVVETENPTFSAVVEEGGLERLPAHLEENGLTRDRAFVITDTNVYLEYGNVLRGVLAYAGIEPNIMKMPAGEENKTQEQADIFGNQLSEAEATRDDVIITFGGGVVGDLGGYVASTHNRGMPLVHLPTTLLAMVDSSIGGKTAVNLGGKNTTGTTYQPELIVTDPTLLKSLPPRIYSEGFGEMVKYGMLDADFMQELEAAAGDIKSYPKNELDVLGDIITRCVKQKIEIVIHDPEERGNRILLNYGHTLGHAIEAAQDYKGLLHGEAISVGMSFAAQLAVRLEMADAEVVERQKNLLRRFSLPTKYLGKAHPTALLGQMGKDKKKTGADTTTRFVLPQAVGRMVVQEVANTEVEEAVTSFIETGRV